MKKLLAFLMAITTCFCTFTACGDNNDSDSKKSGKKSSSESDDDKDDDDKKSDKDDEDDDKKSDKDDEDDDKKSDKDDEDDDKKSDKDDEDDDKKSDKDDEDDDKKSDKDDDVIIDDDDNDNKSDKDEDDDKKKDDKVSNENTDIYKDVLTQFCELAIDKDTEGLMNLTFPDKLIDALIKIDAYDFMVESIDGSYTSMEDINLDLLEIESVSDCDAETVEKLEKLYSVYSELFICMADNGINYNDMQSGNIDTEKAMLLLEPATKLSQLDDIENLDVDIIIPFEEAKYVTINAEGFDQKFVMYKVEGDDWKLDTIGLAMFGF